MAYMTADLWDLEPEMSGPAPESESLGAHSLAQL